MVLVTNDLMKKIISGDIGDEDDLVDDDDDDDGWVWECGWTNEEGEGGFVNGRMGD